MYQSTWVDLARVTELEAQAFGRDPGPGPALAMTCAWFAGSAGFGLWTALVRWRGQDAPTRRAELEEEETPRMCVGNAAEPEELAGPLRHLIELCGGRTGG